MDERFSAVGQNYDEKIEKLRDDINDVVRIQHKLEMDIKEMVDKRFMSLGRGYGMEIDDIQGDIRNISKVLNDLETDMRKKVKTAYTLSICSLIACVTMFFVVLWFFVSNHMIVTYGIDISDFTYELIFVVALGLCVYSSLKAHRKLGDVYEKRLDQITNEPDDE
ncbi:MAG: hypothetical protein HUJ70_15275 [Pseudobutyrivibrio sp.]|nr:hypothetical protein [Pseudobutyrivibrio sp.]